VVGSVEILVSSVVALLLVVAEGGGVGAAGISVVALLEESMDEAMLGAVMPISGFSGSGAMVVIAVVGSLSSVSDVLLLVVVLVVAIGSHDSKAPGGTLGLGTRHGGKGCEEVPSPGALGVDKGRDAGVVGDAMLRGRERSPSATRSSWIAWRVLVRFAEK
jgi:hypothetical protein